MSFEEKMSLLESLKNNVNKSRAIIDKMTYQEKVKLTEIRTRNLNLKESMSRTICGVDLNGESLDDYIKRNNLISYETVKNNIENIIGS